MWINILPKKYQKRFLEIGSERDWSWVTPENRRVLSNHKRRRIIGGWRPYIIEKLEAERLKSILIWVSLVIEKLGIQEEIPRGVFEGICSYI